MSGIGVWRWRTMGANTIVPALFVIQRRSDYSLPSPSSLPLPSPQSDASVHARQRPFGPWSLRLVFFACGHDKPELITIPCDEGILQLEHWLPQGKLFNYYLMRWDVLYAGIRRHTFKKYPCAPRSSFDHAYTVLYWTQDICLPVNHAIISCATNAPAHHLPRGDVLVLKHHHNPMHVRETLLPEDIGLVNASLRRFVMLLQTLHR